MELVAIAAVASNGVIGSGGKMPWNIPQDLARFKLVTMGANLIMGRKTYDSIGGPLVGRNCIVVSRSPGADGRVTWAFSLPQALELADPMRKTFVGGGAQLYREAWPLLTGLDITEVEASPEGDAFFPQIDPADWVQTMREDHGGFAFTTYRRRRAH
ncbi:MAG: dihydrofolate reductase [Propionibacteriaceae bacterium]|jgi:dihydrofolate reductase|nr:dihydrofolate reductase [Propionibacteriaceae bacterium]